jgi:hypothetical protein
MEDSNRERRRERQGAVLVQTTASKMFLNYNFDYNLTKFKKFETPVYCYQLFLDPYVYK